MSLPRSLTTTAVVLFAVVLGRLIGTQVADYRFLSSKTATGEQRQALFDMLRPVALANCTLERFGETHDGGYLMCGNLLGGVQSGYSYGISGYDKWGCDISTRLERHRSTNTTASTRPSPPARDGETVFHAECVGDSDRDDRGRALRHDRESIGAGMATLRSASC